MLAGANLRRVATSVSDVHGATDRWFFRRGLPQFVLDYRSDTDVWTRASPVLVVTFFALALSPVVDIRGMVGGVLLGVVAVGLVVGWGVNNHRRGRRFLALPTRVGWGVLAAYVVIPTALTALATGSAGSTLSVGALALALLVVIWLVTWTALIPLVLWASRWMVMHIADLRRLITRALPLLLVIVTIIFLTTEVWQVAGSLSAGWLWATVGLLVAVAVAFIVARLPAEIARLEVIYDRDEIVRACEGTPLAPVVSTIADFGEAAPLTGLQRLNVLVVMTFAQGVQVALFAVVVWAFFVLFGAVAIAVPVQVTWLGDLEQVSVLWAWTSTHGVTQESLRVATFLAAFSALYATVYSASDAVYREHFFDDISREIDRAIAVRQAYLAVSQTGG